MRKRDNFTYNPPAFPSFFTNILLKPLVGTRSHDRLWGLFKGTEAMVLALKEHSLRKATFMRTKQDDVVLSRGTAVGWNGSHRKMRPGPRPWYM